MRGSSVMVLVAVISAIIGGNVKDQSADHVWVLPPIYLSFPLWYTSSMETLLVLIILRLVLPLILLLGLGELARRSGLV